MDNYYHKRALDFITGNMDTELANASTRFNKEWFIQRMRGAFRILDNKITINGEQKPVSAAYHEQFRDGKMPHPEMNSWMMLFARYQFFQKQATNYVKNLYTPDINDLMEEIITHSQQEPKFDTWFKDPLDYLTDIGSLHIMELERNKKNANGAIITTHKINPEIKLGYREVFSIPKFGEIYCETHDKTSIHLADQLICVDTDRIMPKRYYSLMMCEKLPAEIFFNQNQR